MTQQVKVSVNGKEYFVAEEFLDWSLLQYLRESCT